MNDLGETGNDAFETQHSRLRQRRWEIRQRRGWTTPSISLFSCGGLSHRGTPPPHFMEGKAFADAIDSPGIL